MIQIIITITGSDTASSVDITHNLESVTDSDVASLQMECEKEFKDHIPAIILGANAALSEALKVQSPRRPEP